MVLPLQLEEPIEYVVDIGAYRGLYSLAFLEFYPNILGLIAVEPIPAVARELSNSLKKYRQAKVLNCALAQEKGLAQFNLAGNLVSSSLLEVNPESSQKFGERIEITETLSVPAETLNNLFVQSQWPRIDFLKLDVQGAEALVIQGGEEALRHTRYVLMEVSFWPHYTNQPLFGDMDRLMAQLGFGLQLIIGFRRDGRGFALQADALYRRVNDS
jgi:FkbM family methyltransferase